MCRLTVYKGKSFLIGDLVVRPENGLLYQSRDAGWHPGVTDGMGKRNIRVNADGFGIAWYSREGLDSEEYQKQLEGAQKDFNASSGVYGLRAYMYESCIFKFVTPAWSNKNLRNIGDHIRSNLIFAHVRAGSNGLNSQENFRVTVTEENCHPFQYRQWTFMHNGGIPCFENIKFPLVQLLDEMCWHGIAGNTDSEHIFALFLALLPDRDNPNVELAEFIQTVEKTIACILDLCEKHNGKGNNFCCSLNLVFTDGCHIVATRYRTTTCDGNTEPPSLYYNWGNNFVCENGLFQMKGVSEDGTPFKANEIVISSAPLSHAGGLVLNTQDADCAEYPSEMVFERPDFSDDSGHSGAYSGDNGKRPRSDSHYRQQESSGGMAGYEYMGQWVLMPRNHMLVCVGNEDDPSIVEDVFLQEINDIQETHAGGIEWQMQRRGEMDRKYKARHTESERKKAAESKTQAERKKRFFKQGVQDTNIQTIRDRNSSEISPTSAATDVPTRSQSPLPMKAAKVDRNELASKLPTSPIKHRRKQLYNNPSEPQFKPKAEIKPRSESEPSMGSRDSYYSQLLAAVAPIPVGPEAEEKWHPNMESEYIVVNKKTLWRVALAVVISGGIALAAMQQRRKA